VSVFLEGAFGGLVVLVAVIFAVAMFGAVANRHGKRGAIGLLGLALLAAVVGGVVSLLQSP